MKMSKCFSMLAIGLMATLFAHAAPIGPIEPITSQIDPVKKMTLNGSISHAETKKPLKDVNITAYLDSKREKVASSDSKGSYYFDELKPGIYTLTFQKTGFKKVTREKVIVKLDEAFMLDIEMDEDEYGTVPSPFHFSWR